MLHVHVNEPTVLAHVDTPPAAQLCVFKVHSLLSVHATPFPVKPVLHAHVNEPAVLVQADVPTAQLCVPSVHSLLSEHKTPLPL